MQTVVMFLVVAVTVYLIVKNYQPQTVLLLSGLLLVGIAVVTIPDLAFLPKGAKTTGNTALDVVELIRLVMSSRVAEIGMIIMTAGGFSKYMGHIGAADVMVKYAVKPLNKVGNPYIVLALGYVLGQIINIFIPSAAGLAMLLLVAMYPILVRLGATPAASAAMIATTACLDLGPASGASNQAAKLIGVTPAEYFFNNQIPVAVIAIPVIAILIFFTQKYFDKKDAHNLGEQVAVDKKLKEAPAIFAILPLLPLLLLLIFSKFVIDTIKMDVVTAMIISMLVSMIFEMIRRKSIKTVSKDIMIFFKGMGELFADVVSLIICAEIFAIGFITLGGVDALIKFGESFGFGAFLMMLIMVAIIAFTAVLTGSGNASFFAFGKLAPEIATNLGISPVGLVLPMQLTAGIARSMSPVAGVVIICAGAAKVSPFDIVKRTFIPMVGGMIVVALAGWFL